jgi:hypothetical protein
LSRFTHAQLLLTHLPAAVAKSLRVLYSPEDTEQSTHIFFSDFVQVRVKGEGLLLQFRGVCVAFIRRCLQRWLDLGIRLRQTHTVVEEIAQPTPNNRGV